MDTTSSKRTEPQWSAQGWSDLGEHLPGQPWQRGTLLDVGGSKTLVVVCGPSKHGVYVLMAEVSRMVSFFRPQNVLAVVEGTGKVPDDVYESWAAVFK